MGTRAVVGGRTVFASRELRARETATPVNTDREGKLLSIHPIDSADAPFREGVPYRDLDTDIVVRIVQKLHIAEGWGTLEFWLKRYGCRFETFQLFTEMGLIDAAMEQGSPTIRYRVRDEQKVLDHLKDNPKLTRKRSLK